MKEVDSEANYFSRQLIGLHAVAQHRKLCEVISTFESIYKFSEAYSNSLTSGLSYIFEHL